MSFHKVAGGYVGNSKFYNCPCSAFSWVKKQGKTWDVVLPPVSIVILIQFLNQSLFILKKLFIKIKK